MHGYLARSRYHYLFRIRLSGFIKYSSFLCFVQMGEFIGIEHRSS